MSAFAADVACSVLFFLACFAAVASKVKAGFKLYLLLGLSTLCKSKLRRPPPPAARPGDKTGARL